MDGAGREWDRIEANGNRLEKRRQAMLEMPQMIQTWKEVRLILLIMRNCKWKANNYNREDMDVDGRSGQNKRLTHQCRERDCTTCHQQHITGAQCRKAGVLYFKGLSLSIWLDVYSTSTNRRLYKHNNWTV